MWNWEILEIDITNEGRKTGISNKRGETVDENELWDEIAKHFAMEDTFSFNWFTGSVDDVDGAFWDVNENWSYMQDVLEWATVGADYTI